MLGRFTDVSQFENIIVKTDSANGGQITRIKDVGRVELGSQTYSQAFTLNGQSAAGIAIYQSLDANALDVAKRVKAKLDELSKAFPQGMIYTIPFDTTRFVYASISEVHKTLIEAGVLVLLVIAIGIVALSLWRGRPLADVAYAWLDPRVTYD